MKKIQLYLSAILLAFVTLTACNSNAVSDKNVVEKSYPESVDEANLLLDFFGKSGDFINSKSVPALIDAEKVYYNTDKYLVIDIRSHADYVAGHIEGAVQVKFSDLYNYLNNQTAAGAYEKIVIACHSGQTASYATSILRLVGFGNVYALKYGMSSWKPEYADAKWNKNLSNQYASQLTTKPTMKGKKGELPKLETGEKTGMRIAIARAKKLFEEGFKPVTVKADAVFESPEKYYIINYWPIDQYLVGHIPGAIQYQPKKTLQLDKSLKTIPTNKPAVVYCYTGQHASFVAAYLRMIGYDAKVLLYGANSFMHNAMKNEAIGHAFNAAKIVKDFDVITGELPRPEPVAGAAPEKKDKKTPEIVIPQKKHAQEEVGGC